MTKIASDGNDTVSWHQWERISIAHLCAWLYVVFSVLKVPCKKRLKRESKKQGTRIGNRLVNVLAVMMPFSVHHLYLFFIMSFDICASSFLNYDSAAWAWWQLLVAVVGCHRHCFRLFFFLPYHVISLPVIHCKWQKILLLSVVVVSIWVSFPTKSRLFGRSFSKIFSNNVGVMRRER